MSIETRQIRKGFHTITPYLYGKLDLIDFVKQAFGAEELFRHKYGDQGFHLEVRIGDSMVMLEADERPPKAATVASLHVYVSDVDAAYGRAIRAGATSLREPTDQPYGERIAGVKDSFGNVWWIATPKDSN
jgi:PhnB protein